ncbi:MAG: hypothetical protein J6B89_01290 [Bacilli bacterium]|nr:hypothetical protein [Bacilli bacterium]
MNDRIKTNINMSSTIGQFKSNTANSQITNINTSNFNDVQAEELLIEEPSSKPISEYSISEVLDKIPQNGTLTNDQIDFSRIAISSSDAISKKFLNNVSTSWGSNGEMTYEIYENGSVLIKKGGVGMGYTDIEGISKIIAEVDEKNITTEIKEPTPEIPELIEESPSEQDNKAQTKELFKEYSAYSNMIWNESDVNNITNLVTLIRIKKAQQEYSNNKLEISKMINKNLDDEGWFGRGTTLGENGSILHYDKKENNGDYTIYYYDGQEIKRIKDSYVYFEQSKTSYEIESDGNVTIHSKGQSRSYTDVYKIDGSVEKYVNGRLCNYVYSDGTTKSYKEDGTTYIINNQGQIIQRCYSDGKIRTQYIKDGKVEYIEYYYFTDGSKYEKYSYTDGTSSFVEYDTDGKTIIAETIGTVVYANDCPQDKEMVCKDDYGSDLPGYSHDAITTRKEDNGYTIGYYGEIQNDAVNKICDLVELRGYNTEHYDNSGNLLYIENKDRTDTVSGAYTINTNIINTDGTCTAKVEVFDENDKLVRISTKQYDQNVLREESRIDNEEPEFNSREVYDANGECIARYDENNFLWYEVKDGLTYNYDINTGLPWYIKDANGTTYYKNGVEDYFVDNDGNFTPLRR